MCDLSVNWNAPLYAAPAPGHHKIEVTPAVAVGDPGKGGRANETVTPTLTAQVGGACSIVHVLEWKEGMAILPSSNLKVNRYLFLNMYCNGQPFPLVLSYRLCSCHFFCYLFFLRECLKDTSFETDNN